MAHCGQQRGAQAVCLLQWPQFLRGIGQLALQQRDFDLRNERLEDSPIGCLEVAPAQHDAVSVAELDGGTGRRRRFRHRMLRGLGLVQHRPLVGDGDTVQAERLPHPVGQRRHGVLAPDDAARHGGEGLRFGGGPPGGPAAPLGPIDDEADENGHEQKDEKRQQMEWLADRDGVHRLHEKEVQGQSRGDGGERPWPDASDQRDHDNK